MSVFQKYFWLVTLVLFVGGCSSYKMVTVPGLAGDVDAAREMENSLKPGDQVRLALNDGSELKGEVLDITDMSLRLDTADREPNGYGWSHQADEAASGVAEIPISDVAAAEKCEFNAGKSLLYAACVVGALLGLGAAIMSAGGGFNMGVGP